MKKLITILLLFSLCLVFTSCRKDTRVYMTDGIDYKNTDLEIKYASSESVNVTFSADIYTYSGTVVATVVLVSENCVIGEIDIKLYCKNEDEPYYTATETVELSYHNYGAITAYVDKITAYYYIA